MAEMNVELVAVDRRVWSGTATSVIVRTVEGDIGVLPGHAPLLAELKEGYTARIVLTTGEEVSVAVHGGFLSVTRDRVSILAEDAQLASEINVAEAQAAYTEAQRRADGLETAEVLRARAQLLAAGHHV